MHKIITSKRCCRCWWSYLCFIFVQHSNNAHIRWKALIGHYKRTCLSGTASDAALSYGSLLYTQWCQRRSLEEKDWLHVPLEKKYFSFPRMGGWKRVCPLTGNHSWEFWLLQWHITIFQHRIWHVIKWCAINSHLRPHKQDKGGQKNITINF